MEEVAQRTRVLPSLQSLEVQSPGKVISFVEWEHKAMLLLRGTSGDGSLGFLAQKTVVAPWNCHWLLLLLRGTSGDRSLGFLVQKTVVAPWRCHWLLLLGDACFEDFHLLLRTKVCIEVRSFGKLEEGSLMWWQAEVENWLAWDFESETSSEMELEHLD